MKTIQVGDTCTVIKCFLHPSRLLSKKYPNQDHGETLDGLLVTGVDESRVINKFMKQVVLFRHEDFENEILYCIPRYARVTNGEGQPAIPNQEDAVAADLIEMPEATGNMKAPLSGYSNL